MCTYSQGCYGTGKGYLSPAVLLVSALFRIHGSYCYACFSTDYLDLGHQKRSYIICKVLDTPKWPLASWCSNKTWYYRASDTIYLSLKVKNYFPSIPTLTEKLGSANLACYHKGAREVSVSWLAQGCYKNELCKAAPFLPCIEAR